MPFGGALTIGGLALAGGIAGNMKDRSRSTQGVILGDETELERQTTASRVSDFNSLRDMAAAGPGQADVAAGYGAQKDLAAMLMNYSQGGYQPSAADISSSNDLATKLFGAQRVAMGQNFQDQRIQSNNQAALLGRAGNDPILAAKLAQEQTRQAAVLDAQQGGWATQYALQQPMQRLGFMQDATNLKAGLATQAMANRQALLNMGSQLIGEERNWRYNIADKFGSQESGGGFKGALTGALAGASAGMGMVSGMAGGGGAAAAGGGAGGFGGAGALSGMNYSQAPSQFFGMQSSFTSAPSPAAAQTAFQAQNVSSNLSYPSTSFGARRYQLGGS